MCSVKTGSERSGRQRYCRLRNWYGVSIVANKYKGVYAALCESVWTARRAKTVNNTNVLCMGGFVVGPVMAVEMANAWLQAEHLQGLDPEIKEIVKGEFHSIEEVEEKEYK